MNSRARLLRENSSSVERRMWQLLWSLRTGGYHFRKQVQIGPYVVDFACHHARLVIEVDGETHFSPVAQRRDAARDAFLRDQGYRVLRFTNLDVMGNPDGVFATVAAVLADRPTSRRGGHPLPNPPHKGEGVRPGVLRGLGLQSDVDATPDLPRPQDGTSPLVGEVGRGVGQPDTGPVAHPLPDPPHKGEGARSGVLRERGLQR